MGMGGKGNKKQASADPETTGLTDSLDFKDSIITARDPATRAMAGSLDTKTVQFNLVQTNRLACIIGDRELKRRSYALAKMNFKANRNMFKAIPGMLFNISYPMYDIDSMIVRVTKIEEEGPESEIITVYLEEDFRYSGQTCIRVIPNTRPDPIILPIETIENVKAVEVPYVLANGEYMKVGIIASRITGNEIAYGIYMSVDGISYSLIGNQYSWAVHGKLDSDYSKDTYTIDDDIGFEVIFDTTDGGTLESTTRSGLFTSVNLCLLGDEVIAFQTITPVSTKRYRLTGVLRAKYDTVKQDHYKGEDFYFIGSTGMYVINNTDDMFYYSGTRYFKVVPFNGVSYSGLADATAFSINFDKRAFTPYSPTNLKANGCGLNSRAEYGPSHPEHDIYLEWMPRIRTGQGCGFGDLDISTDASPTWEGLFRIKVYVSGVLCDTIEGINALNYTYDSITRGSKCGGNPYEITFTVTNYTTSGSEEYESEGVSLIVRRGYPILG